MNASQGTTRRTVLKGSAALAAAGVAMPALVHAADTVNVAAVLPVTGPSAQFGQVSWKAMQFSIELMNEAGGVKSMGGARLTAAVYDTETKPDVAVTQTEQAIQRGASVIVGCNQSAATIVASQVAERNEVPFITAYDIDPAVTARGFKYVFRCSPLTANYAADLLACIKELRDKQGGGNKLSLLSENSVTGQGVNKALTENAKTLGFDIVSTATYDVGSTQNFAPFIAKVKASNADVLIGHNRVSDGILIARTAKELAYNPVAMGGVLGATNTHDFIVALGKDAENMFGTDSFALGLNIPGMKEVAEKHKAKLDRVMDIGTVSIMSDIGVIWNALERSKTGDRKALRDAIAATDMKSGENNFFLLRGAKFNGAGDNVLGASIITQIQNAATTPVWPTEFAIGKAVYPKPAWA